MQSALVDSGPLIALFDRDDAYHDAVKAFLKATPLKLTTTWPVLTEVCALLPQLPAFDFMDFACRGGVDVEDLDAADLSSMLGLSRKYSNVPTDFADASEETQPSDEVYVRSALTGIKSLNNRYCKPGPDRFFLFHRRRLWNPIQQCWMGWERKRGKLVEFNRLVRGAKRAA